MKKMLARLLSIRPEIVTIEKDKIIILDSKPMGNDEYVFAFLIDDNTPFFKAIVQLCRTMKADYLEQCNNPTITDRSRLDNLAKMGAIDDFLQTILFQKDNAIRERDARNEVKK
jgi:hypothetical protein